METDGNSGIMRFQKLKSFEEIHRVFRHIFREQNTPNADSTRFKLNENLTSKLAGDTDGCMGRVRDRIAALDKAPRANAVLAVEFIFTASPQAMKCLTASERRKYFTESVKWIVKKVGIENLISAQIHRDETTEHCHLIILPVPRGQNRLNCRELLGGHKSRASELQDEFHECVSSNFGLGRGVKGSRAKHQSLRNYNTIVIKSLPSLRAEKKKLENQCNVLEERISKGRKVLDSITTDIKKALEEHSQAVQYCLAELKNILKKRWGMIYEGPSKLKNDADEFLRVERENSKGTVVEFPQR